MKRDEFEAEIIKVIKDLPDEFKNQLDNVEITVESWPVRRDLKGARIGKGASLFGLYRGIPKTKRNIYYSSPPDKITIFAGPILNHFNNNDEIRDQIRKTVLHEIGHHFGMSEDRIRKAQDN